MHKKKLKLRPWVKISMFFVIGVLVVAKIFSMMGASASDDVGVKMYHGVIKLNINGKSHLSVLENEYAHDHEGELWVTTKKDYQPTTIITVIMDGDTVIEDYITKGKELKGVEKKHQWDIDEVRRNIVESIYE